MALAQEVSEATFLLKQQGFPEPPLKGALRLVPVPQEGPHQREKWRLWDLEEAATRAGKILLMSGMGSCFPLFENA